MTHGKNNNILSKGEIINNTYEVLFFEGEGAFGEVFRVKHIILKENFAIKVFKEKYTNEVDPKIVLQEGKILMKLTHENVVRVFDVNTFKKNDVDYYFMVMNYVSGESLTKLINRKIQLDLPVATSIMIDVLKGLSVAHQNKLYAIVHRDINSDNILLSYDDYKPFGILGDFGIATLVDQRKSLPGAGGRYLYFAPECFLDLCLPTSDVFSAGVVLYKILTGVHPWSYDFDGTTRDDMEGVKKAVNSSRKKSPIMPSIYNENINKEFENVMMKSLEKKMDKRYPNADSFLRALKNVCKTEDPSGGYWQDQALY